jgi:hypothetical protein
MFEILVPHVEIPILGAMDGWQESLVGGLELVFFHSVGNFIIPTDSYFSEG